MTDPLTAATFAKLGVMLLQSLSYQPAITGQSAARQIQMPASIAELGETVLRCYHRTGKFSSIDVVERPWRRGKQYAATSSVLVQVNWKGISGRPIRTRIALVTRNNQIRAVVEENESRIPARRSCAFNRWIKIAEHGQNQASKANSNSTADLNSARAEFESLLEAASAVALGGEKVSDGREAIRADLIAQLARSVLKVKAAIKPPTKSDQPNR